MKTTLTAADYTFEDDDIKISMSVHFDKNNFSLSGVNENLDYAFTSADPERAAKIARLMMTAAEYAGQVLRHHEIGECPLNGASTKVITEVKIARLIPETV